MLPTVTGLFAIPSEVNLKMFETGKGSYLSFSLIADSGDKKQQYHRYNANMWVPNTEVSKWTDKLKTGNIFLLAGGEWRMKESEGSKYPFPILSIDYNKFKQLKTPLWDNTDDGVQSENPSNS